jgi:hypothetical protein
MIYHKSKKTLITFLLISLLPLFSFAFDANSTHPALTEEIVKFYNSFAERKITNEELELLKQGSILEDSSPRWVNHFYDVFHNLGLNLATIRGASSFEINAFLKFLPYQPLKSPEWARNEIVQSKYLNNRTYQRAKRLYFENKNEALITLGHLLHLLEDLGVPDHARGDSHGGLFGDPKSNYEDYAKYITDRYYLTFAQELIKNNAQPYNFSDIDSFFSSLSKFTASHWFSEDTIDLRNEFFSEPRFRDLILDTKTQLYYLNGRPVLKVDKPNDESLEKIVYTTKDNQIHQAWFNSIVPEIIKHGAGLLNFYFSEIKEIENEQALLLYEKDIGRRVELANFFGVFSNLPSYTLTKAWQGGEAIFKVISGIKETISPSLSIVKTQYSLKIEKKEEQKLVPQPQLQQKQEEKITYKEEKKEITISIKNKQTGEIKTTTLDLSNTKTFKLNTSTQTTSTLSLRQQIIPTSTQIFSQTSYIRGGGGVTIQKDKCDDYKNKNYPKIIINEIQFETASDTRDEFIELYNPNNEEIDLTCWKLEKYTSKQSPTSTPSLTTLIPSSKFQGKIKPNGYFLITSSSTKEKYQGDLAYAESYSISKNNVIILRKPNGEISDLVGYGDDAQRIYQYENSPFIAQNFENKSIQRKNFQDTDDNSKDFWLHKPSPKNSSITESPRQDFIDLTATIIQNFNVVSTSTEDSYFLNISFNEPNPEAGLSVRFRASNYSYELLVSTSTKFSTFNLVDFGVTSTLPLPKFDGSTASLSFEINKCPTTSTIYYFALFIKDNLDEENKSNPATSSATLAEDLCNPGESTLVQNISTTTTSTGKILFSEIYIKEGTSTGEFIELYNPNEFDIDLTGWEIRKINRNGKEQTIIPSSKFKGIIPSFSYFLLVNANTSLEITTNPDFIYPKSYDLAKDNGLILIDKEGKVIDKVCWRDILNTDFQNCISNPTSTSLSLQRKKTATSTPETIINQNLGNAYSTNNSSNDFLYAPINPENSSITRPTIKDIQNFQVSNQGKIYNFSWLSPAYYDENLSYELLISTSSPSTFQIIASTTFKILENQSLSLNLCNLNIPSGTDLYFQLNLLNNSQILKTASTSIKMINCFDDITQSFRETSYQEDLVYVNPSFFAIRKITWGYEILNNVNFKKIKIIFTDCQPMCYVSLFSNLNPLYFKIFKIVETENVSSDVVLFDDLNAATINVISDAPPPSYVLIRILIIELLQPITFNQNDNILISIQGDVFSPRPGVVFEGEVLP